MKKLWHVAVVLASTISGANAQGSSAHPSTLNMTCTQAKASVERNMTVILATGGGKFDRYVSTEGKCAADSPARPAFVPTADSLNCDIGYYCSNESDDK